MKTKQCSKCGQMFPKSGFHKHRGRPDGLCSYCKQCNYQNARAYIAKKPEYYAEYQRQYHLKHLEAHHEYGRRYSKIRYQAHRAIYRQYVRVYRARKRGHKAPTLTAIKARIRQCGGRCIYCGGPYEHLDHVVPVSRNGADRIENLVPSCASCNLSKTNKHWRVWFRSQSFFSSEREQQIAAMIESPQSG